MSGTDKITKTPRVDAAGRPLEGRLRQALIALAIILCWLGCIGLIFWSTQGGDRAMPAYFMFGIFAVCWLGAEAVGVRRAQIWPASAMAIAGSLSLGFGVSMSTPAMRSALPADAMVIIASVAAAGMLGFLFRFRLPGLVSPIISFSVISLFLGLYGADQQSMAEVEGFSARGILAALIKSPLWMAGAGFLGLIAALFARRLDLKGDDFGVASARPLHMIGAGVLALVIGKALAIYPFPTDVVTLVVVWIAAFYWALRINRVAVLVAIHLAMMKPLVLSIAAPTGWAPSIGEWSGILFIIVLFDLAVWPRLHHLSLRNGWTLGPGGRIPQERDGWLWRYWPYA